MKKAIFIFALVLISGFASGRDQDGSLSVILSPNEGRPAIVIPSAKFEIELSRKVDSIFLGEARLVVDWTELPGGKMLALCTVPEKFLPGTYALNAVFGNKKDFNSRSVFVMEAFPEQYTVAHISDVGNHAVLRDSAKAANESKAALVLITGNLTSKGTLEEFSEFLNALGAFDAPTFVSPGIKDRLEGNYQKVFSDPSYMFQFGEDGYISVDTSRVGSGDLPDSHNGDLQLFRRAIKPCRWSTGFTYRYETGMDMRTQIVLFVDNPLDYFISGGDTPAVSKTPWGKRPVTVTSGPVEKSGPSIFEVTQQGMQPVSAKEK